MTQFMSERHVKMDMVFVDKFWNSLDNNDDTILVDEAILACMGYTAQKGVNAQQSLEALLKRHDISYEKIGVSDETDADFPSIIKEEAALIGSKHKRRRRWLVLKGIDFKSAAFFSGCNKMQRWFLTRYLTLDKLRRDYTKYVKEEKQVYTSALMNVADAIKENVSKTPSSDDRREVMAVVAMSQDYVHDEETDPAYTNGCQGVVVRCQKRSLTGRLRRIASWGQGTNAKAETLLVKANINSVNVVNHVRDDGRFAIVVCGVKLTELQTMEEFGAFVERYADSLHKDVVVSTVMGKNERTAIE